MGMLMHRHESFRNRHEAAAVETTPEPPVVVLRFEEMTVAQLRVFAAGQGIELGKARLRPQLLAVIDQALTERANAELEAASENQEPVANPDDQEGSGLTD